MLKEWYTAGFEPTTSFFLTAVAPFTKTLYKAPTTLLCNTRRVRVMGKLCYSLGLVITTEWNFFLPL